MDKNRLLAILSMVSSHELQPAEALERLRTLPFEDLGFAKVDLHRTIRLGMPETIYCPGKTAEQIREIAQRLRAHHDLILATRATPIQAQAITAKINDAIYHDLAKVLVIGPLPEPNNCLPTIAIVTAGTADIPVAEEAALVLQAAGIPLVRIHDVGVAGIHRLFDSIPLLAAASVTIVVAGMDGALASVIGGLLGSPVIAVPTSSGYGANLDGLAPLLTMLNSCAAGLTVVNIDNGFGAATAAVRIVNLLRESRVETSSKNQGETGAGSIQ